MPSQKELHVNNQNKRLQTGTPVSLRVSNSARNFYSDFNEKREVYIYEI